LSLPDSSFGRESWPACATLSPSAPRSWLRLPPSDATRAQRPSLQLTQVPSAPAAEAHSPTRVPASEEADNPMQGVIAVADSRMRPAPSADATNAPGSLRVPW